MKKEKPDTEWIFITTIIISFVLLIHNGTEPLFLIAFVIMPFLILHFYYKRSFYPLIIFLLFIAIYGRYTRYLRETYASDTLLAIRDFIGYFVHGKHIYKEMIMAQSGLTPFTYLPFSIFWYLPAYILKVDLRFFEMIISSLVPLSLFIYGRLLKTYKILPLFAIVSLTPFLLDLSADRSNDNSAIFILLLSIITFAYAIKNKNNRYAILSAIILGFAASFKHYVFFYLFFFLLYLYQNKKVLPFSSVRYIFYFVVTVFVISGPFILTSPEGFYRSLSFIELTNWHKTWGWNIWVALRDIFQVTLDTKQMWLVRTILTSFIAVFLVWCFKLSSYRKVFIASGVTLFVYLAFSQWTTYAYFTFLIPLLGLGAFSIEDDNS